MSIFRRPKKTVQRRVFTYEDDGSDSENDSNDLNKVEPIENPTPKASVKLSKIEKNQKNSKEPKRSCLLSFDDEDEGEVFQVKKTSQSKKVMKQLDRERKKKKNKNVNTTDTKSSGGSKSNDNGEVYKETVADTSKSSNSKEVVLDDFVLRVKNVEPDPIILNGRAALCAGKNDMSSEEEEEDTERGHRFTKPDNFKTVLESGVIPDAAMIHAARKSRQKAREQGEFIPLEEAPMESKKQKKQSRFLKEDAEDDGSDNERVDMSAINGAKERAERREQFYSVQEDGDESDPEINEWENQQLRKGVTGAQLVSAQQESAIYSQYLTKQSTNNQLALESSGSLLQQIYAKNSIETIQVTDPVNQQKDKINRLRMPKEVAKKLAESLSQLEQLNIKHISEIDQIESDLEALIIDYDKCEKEAPVAAEKYRYYQELRGYITDLIECLDEKVPLISDIEKRAMALMSKQASYLIKRRHQDVRDQAQEISEAGKPRAARKMLDDEDRVRRAADREGRRTRRRQIREKIDLNNTHMDGMSSDDEIHQDHEAAVQKSQLEQCVDEANHLFDDTTYEFCEMPAILERFEDWRCRYMKSYNDIYFSLCLPKILGPMIRIHLVTWNPLLENCQDIERMDWYKTAIKYGWRSTETESSLNSDPDSQLIPILIEKIILPKLTELIESCWDPLSTSQVLRLVGLIGRFGREYPSIKASSKYLQTLFMTVIQKMRLSLDNDVFIPIYAKHTHETARSSFFQRQFSNGLKLFRNFLSWQGILADNVLKELAITSLLNRYFLPALRVCTPIDATTKAHIIVNTLPRVWLQRDTGIIHNLDLFIQFLKHTATCLDKKHPHHLDSIEKLNQILHSLHASTEKN